MYVENCKYLGIPQASGNHDKDAKMFPKTGNVIWTESYRNQNSRYTESLQVPQTNKNLDKDARRFIIPKYLQKVRLISKTNGRNNIQTRYPS